MALKRMEHIGIMFDDLAATKFFVELRLKLLGEGSVEVTGWTAAWDRRRPGSGRDDADPRMATDYLSW